MINFTIVGHCGHFEFSLPLVLQRDNICTNGFFIPRSAQPQKVCRFDMCAKRYDVLKFIFETCN